MHEIWDDPIIFLNCIASNILNINLKKENCSLGFIFIMLLANSIYWANAETSKVTVG